MASLDSFKCRQTLTVGDKTYEYYSLPLAEKKVLSGHRRFQIMHNCATMCIIGHERQ